MADQDVSHLMTRLLDNLLNSSLKKLARYAILVALLARIAVPAGFMPGDTSEGWFLQLCPNGLAPATMLALLGDSHDQHHHSTDDRPDYDADCLLSGLYLVVLPAQDLNLPEPPLAIESSPTLLASPVLLNLARAYRSRAPPLA